MTNKHTIAIKPQYATIRSDEITRLDPCPHCGKVGRVTRDTNEGYILEHGKITCTIGDTEVIRYYPPVGMPIVCDRCEDAIIELGRHLTVEALSEYEAINQVR
jgi:hypothetical protein